MTQLELENPISIIKGRIEPKIYAFRTHTVPDYVKIGDTTRTIEERLEEWRRHFEDLEQIYGRDAKTDNGKFFRDLAIHEYLEKHAPIKHVRLTQELLERIEKQKGTYYSREFFKDIEKKDIDEAIADINAYAHEVKQDRYTFYSEDNLKLDDGVFPRTLKCEHRDLQSTAIKNFIKARKAHRTHLLMYAVMRFGKSITALQCAKAMKARVVLVVSAKVDVLAEWKYTTESFEDFAGYKFLTQQDLRAKGCIKKYLSGKERSTLDNKEKYDKVVIFASLQDLSGRNKDKSLKQKFEDLYQQKIDLLIVDETHYGARGESYSTPIPKGEAKAYDESIDELKGGLDTLKDEYKLDATVQLHLSGTPYRILMGSEFSKEDVIIQCQYSDIVKAKEDWDAANLTSKDPDENNDIAGKNPYFGFPQMIRFAFTPNESAQKWMRDEEDLGHSCSLNTLFAPTPTKSKKDGQYHFIHEQEVLDLLMAIDGSQHDSHILDILNLKQIKEGHLCHHVVMVLPYQASCDAMVNLLSSYKGKFLNLGEYELINIAGKTKGKEMLKKDYTEIVKDRIKKAEREGRKTIVLTVGRMLTGVTVPEWDTMLFMKEASSPQEYDQAIYRLQSPYVMENSNSDGKKTKIDMKPQTLLVDFDVNRMFYLQEQKSLIHDINENKRGVENLKMHIERELEISPVLMMSIANGKLKRADANDVIDAIRNYSANKSIRDEASSVSELLDSFFLEKETIKAIANKYKELNSKNGFSTATHKGGDDLSLGAKHGPKVEDSDIDEDSDPLATTEKPKEESIQKKMANFIARILFFALLTDTNVQSLEDIARSIKHNKNNERIAKNVGIDLADIELIIKELKNHKQATCDCLNDLDIKIQNVRKVLNDESIKDPVERVNKALKKFGRLSESEIVTPSHITKKMVDLLPKGEISNKTKFLDIASKEGEFACALYKKFTPAIKDNIYAIPTSSLTYEFTRKVFSLLGIPVNNIFTFYSKDLITKNKEQYINQLENMKFDVIVGNPPYHINDGGAGSSATPIYNLFVDVAKTISSRFVTLIMPARWYCGGKGLDEFRDHMLTDKHMSVLHDYIKSEDCFSSVEIKGGICFFLRDSESATPCKIYTHYQGEKEQRPRYLKSPDSDVFIRFEEGLGILKKVIAKKKESFDKFVSTQKPFGLRTFIHGKSKPFKDSITIYENGGVGYIKRDDVEKNKEWIDRDKIFVSRAYNAGDGFPHQIIGKPIYGAKGTCCTETYIVIGPLKNEIASQHIEKYMCTKFFRFLVLLRKISQQLPSTVFTFVPVLDFESSSPINWEDSIEKIDRQLYEYFELSEPETQFIDSMIKSM